MHTSKTLRMGKPYGLIDYHETEVPEEAIAAYQGLHKLALISAHDLLSQCDLSQHRTMADFGGGTGGLAIALTHRLPELHVTVLDLAAAIALAKDYVKDVPQKERIQLQVHDVVQNPLNQHYDAIVMRAFTQVLSPVQNQRMLKHSFQALHPQGYLYIIARVLDDDRINPQDTALMNLVFLNLYEEGEAFTESEYRDWLSQAGFVDIERFVQSRGDSIIRAVKPA